MRGDYLGSMDRYLRWNEGLAEAVYPPQVDARPAYMSLDAEQRGAVSAELGIQQSEFEASLADCVRGVLILDSSGPVEFFQRINWELGRWRRSRREQRGAPPVLPLLAVLAVAAERMASSDGMAENNFYGRVREVLEYPDERRHFEYGYRRFGERYWGVLNKWLEGQDGKRGLPTAVAVGHRYVGLPISQVLVREADRERLPHFFIYAGFPPGAVVPPKELEPAFDRWIRREPCPASPALLHHWSGSSGKQRILESVSTALATWNGHVVHQEGDDVAIQASLALNIGKFPRPRVEFSPIAYLTNADEPRDGEIRTDRGWEPVDLVPFATGIMRIGDPQAFDNPSMLEGVLEVKDTQSGRTIERRPRRIMVFRRVDHAGAFLEAEQTMLGEDILVVVRSHGRLLAKVEKILSACARPGWAPYPPGYGGLPEGWTLFHGVQILANPGELVSDTSIDLRALVPLTNSQLLVSGGLPLPGSARGKWHRGALPEVRVVSDDPQGFEVKLFDLQAEDDDDDDVLLGEWRKNEAGALVLDLADQELGNGNYRLELKPASSAQTESTMTIRVRSGDVIDQDQVAKSEPVDQFLDDPLSILAASAVEGERSLFGGLLENPADRDVHTASVPEAPHWKTKRSERRKLTLSISTLPPDSCLYTGAHHTQIETVSLDSRGRPLAPYTVGACTKCGLVRHFPSSHLRAKKREVRRGRQEHSLGMPSLSNLLPTAKSSTLDWDVVLDGLFHCGAGNAATFSRLSSFLEPTALMVHHLLRTLSSLGHVELMRDPESLELAGWEVSPTTLIPTSRGWFLSGHWPEQLVRAQLAADPDLKLERVKQLESPRSRYFDHFPDKPLQGVHEGAGALALAVQLPVLSEVIAALPRTPAPSRASGLSLFDPASAKWEDADSMAVAGGYRMRSFATVDLLRDWDDLERRTMALSTVHLSKHAAALLWKQKPLVAYNRTSQILSVPLGTNLPGLYERAAVFASGLAPVAQGGSLHYLDISPELAGHLTYLLSN